jgi:hypothetical protein
MSLKVQSVELFAVPIELKVTWTELFTASIKLCLPYTRLFAESLLPEVVSIQLLLGCAKLKAQSAELFLALAEVCEMSMSYRV